MAGGLHALADQQFLGELLAGAQGGVADLDIAATGVVSFAIGLARLKPREPDQVAGHIMRGQNGCIGCSACETP